jgi:hypothetical protein
MDQDGWAGFPQTGSPTGFFIGPGLRFGLTALNERESAFYITPIPPHNVYTRPFAIRFEFQPEDANFTFDPRAVTLQIGAGPAINSSGFNHCAGPPCLST